MPNGLHRSMHELRMGHDERGASARPLSPTTSQKSKKSTRSEKFRSSMMTGNHGANHHSKNHHKKHERPHSRPHSRNQRHHRKSSKDSRLRHSSRTRASSRRRSMSSEEEEDFDLQEDVDSDAAAVINDDMTDEDSEDFFTGESDNDFVSLSSGSNSKARAPRKSWTCEHCTYVNNPGVAVCAVCCRTSKQSRGEEFERSASRSSNHHQRIKKKAAAAASKWTKYDTSEEDDSLRRSVSRQSAHDNHLKRKGSSRTHKKKAKSPMPEYNVSDLDEDAINDYYAVRHMSSDKRYESSSETGSSMHHHPPTRKPNFDAPAPAKGILKKSNSNPHLTKLELDAKVGSGSGKHGPPSHVVDIKKYLAQTQNNPHLNHDTKSESGVWPERQETSNREKSGGVTDSDGESMSSTTNNIGRMPPPSSMTRSLSGHSLGDLEYLQQQYDRQQQQHGKFPSRKTSDAGMASGKKNFRSKRFSRNLEREPAIRRAQSLHMDRRTMEENDGFLETHRGVLRKASMGGKPSSSGSSGQEDTLHFTATVEGQEVTGSYLARQEFGGTTEAGLAAVGDSGYISHSSGGGGPNTSYTKNSNLRVSSSIFLKRNVFGFSDIQNTNCTVLRYSCKYFLAVYRIFLCIYRARPPLNLSPCRWIVDIWDEHRVNGSPRCIAAWTTSHSRKQRVWNSYVCYG